MASAVSPPSRIKLLSYNIDGLNEFEVHFRTSVIISSIISEDPDVVQLQEVILPTYGIIKDALEKIGYVCSGLQENSCHYFTTTLVKRNRFKNVAFEVEEFRGKASSKQGRTLLKTKANFLDNLPCLFINCHLESTGAAFKSQESIARMEQLRRGLSLLAGHATGPAFLSGDLNIRDQEAAFVLRESFLAEPSGALQIIDVGHVLDTGVDGKAKPRGTWFLPGNDKVSCRFDRIFMNNPSLNSSVAIFVPVSYDVIGEDKIFGAEEGASYLTASDHRAVIATFDVPLTSISAPTSSSVAEFEPEVISKIAPSSSSSSSSLSPSSKKAEPANPSSDNSSTASVKPSKTSRDPLRAKRMADAAEARMRSISSQSTHEMQEVGRSPKRRRKVSEFDSPPELIDLT